MRLLVQRVKSAKVTVRGEVAGEIEGGILLLVGVGKGDTEKEADKLSAKLANLRIFEDTQGKMNLDIRQVKGSVLSVPQFTLYADTKKGNRPGFDNSAPPRVAEDLWRKFNEGLIAQGIRVESGVFGAHMEVSLLNDGPVTIWLDSED